MEATVDDVTTNNSDHTAEGSRRTDQNAVPDFFEAMLTDDEVVDDLVCNESGLTATLHRLLLLAVSGLLIYGFALGLVLYFYHGAGFPGFAGGQNDHFNSAMVWMPPTVAGGFLAAILICLPAFYFYTQLSGLDASFRLITAQSLRVQARTSVILLGVMPFWVTLALMPFLSVEQPMVEPTAVLAIGIVLPFLVGFSGLYSVYKSFGRLVQRLPITHRRRGNFVLRLVGCWAAVMGCVTPVAMYRIGEFLAGVV